MYICISNTVSSTFYPEPKELEVWARWGERRNPASLAVPHL